MRGEWLQFASFAGTKSAWLTVILAQNKEAPHTSMGGGGGGDSNGSEGRSLSLRSCGQPRLRNSNKCPVTSGGGRGCALTTARAAASSILQRRNRPIRNQRERKCGAV